MKKGSIKLSPLQKRIDYSKGWLFSRNAFAIKFEDLIGKQGGGSEELQLNTIRAMLDFLDIQKSEEEINLLADNLFYKKAETFYKGQIRLWETEFKNNDIHISDELEQVITELGYEKN